MHTQIISHITLLQISDHRRHGNIFSYSDMDLVDCLESGNRRTMLVAYCLHGFTICKDIGLLTHFLHQLNTPDSLRIHQATYFVVGDRGNRCQEMVYTTEICTSSLDLSVSHFAIFE